MVIGPPGANAQAFGIAEAAILCFNRSAPRVRQSLWCMVLRAVTRMRSVQHVLLPHSAPYGAVGPLESWGSYGADVGLGGS